MRLIDADALDETFSKLNDNGWQLTRGDHKRMESVLFEMPAIDAIPVVHGEWKPHNIRLCLYSCSNCRCVPRDKTPYCPICGAKMDGGDHNAAD